MRLGRLPGCFKLAHRLYRFWNNGRGAGAVVNVARPYAMACGIALDHAKPQADSIAAHCPQAPRAMAQPREAVRTLVLT